MNERAAAGHSRLPDHANDDDDAAQAAHGCETEHLYCLISGRRVVFSGGGGPLSFLS